MIVALALALGLGLPQDPALRPLPDGGHVVVARDADAGPVLARVGLALAGPPAERAALFAGLRALLAGPTAATLTAGGATWDIEAEDDALTVTLAAPFEAHADMVTGLVRALAGVRPEARAPRAERLAPVARVDLGGARMWLGPEPRPGDLGAALVHRALRALESSAGAGPVPEPGERPAEPPSRDQLVLGLFGDIDVEGALHLAARAAEGLPRRPGAVRGAAGPPPLVFPLEPEVWVDLAPERDVGAVVFLYRGPRADAPDAAAHLVLEELARVRLAASVDTERHTVGLSVAPGFGRSGRAAAWIAGERAGLVAAAARVRDVLAGFGAPDGGGFGAGLEAARVRAQARLVPPDAGQREGFERAHRLALRGVDAGARARLVAEVAAVSEAALAALAQRTFARDAALAAACVHVDDAPLLAALGRVVPLPDGDSPTPDDDPAGDALRRERAADEAALERLLAALGGRAAWSAAHVVELDTRVVDGPRTHRVAQLLDLDRPRFVLRVADGGETVCDGATATWRGAGLTRTLDPTPLVRDARLGVLTVLHQLARADGLTARRIPTGLALEREGETLATLELGADGLPTRLASAERADGARSWRFEDWRTSATLALPARVIDEQLGVTTYLDTCRVLPETTVW